MVSNMNTLRILFSDVLVITSTFSPNQTTKTLERTNMKCRDYDRNFPRWRPTVILDLVQPEVVPFDPVYRLPRKTYAKTIRKVDRVANYR